MLLSGIFTIEYKYVDEVILYIRETFLVESVQTPVITAPVQTTFCQNEPSVQLTSNVAGTVFTGPGVTGNILEGFMFNPGQANLGFNIIKCTVTSENGCSRSCEMEITVLFTPDVLFTMSSNCVGQYGGEVAFSNLTPGKILVESWDWNFGDPASGELNSSDLVEPAHFYESAGNRSISLTVTTVEGCVNSYVMDTVIGVLPVARFNWITDCYEDGVETLFLNKSLEGSADIDSLNWKFRTSDGSLIGEVGTTSVVDTVRFRFDDLGTYTVDLYVVNGDGCFRTTSEEIELRPTITLKDAFHNEDFDGSDGLWTVHTDGEAASWTWDTPDFTGFVPSPGDLAWFTQIPEGEVGYREDSWLQSPCFNFSGTKVPVIQMDLMRSFVPQNDGAVLQYQDVVEQGWKNVGSNGTGIQWYNSSTIINEPGGSATGWSLQVFNPDSDWVTARHDLDMVKGKKHVSFRIAVTAGTQGIGDQQGFAFDNFGISERTKQVVIEHFTNSASANAMLADDIVDDVAGDLHGNVIDLQYHMDTPGADPMNQNNPLSPTARFTENGGQEVPFTTLDGGLDSDQRYGYADMTSESFRNKVVSSTLEIPAFDVELEVEE